MATRYKRYTLVRAILVLLVVLVSILAAVLLAQRPAAQDESDIALALVAQPLQETADSSSGGR